MPKQKTDDLIQLIRSLTRAEKRHFRLFVRRNQSSDDILFLQLFDFLDRYKDYDEAEIMRKVPGVKKQQLSNLKAHLYKQLLTSLRLLHRVGNEDMEIREVMDHARVLYNKGLYRQSLEMLDKAKARALRGMFYNQALEVVEMEKLIEGQYITHSIEGRAGQLAAEATAINRWVSDANLFSNLALQLYSMYLKGGFVSSEKEFFYLREFFHANLPKTEFSTLGFWGKVYYCQSHLWYYHVTQDFAMSYRYAQKWVNLFRDESIMQTINTPIYLKGLHNLLSALYNTLQYERFTAELAALEVLPSVLPFGDDKNVEGLYKLFWYVHLIQKHYMEGTFSEGLAIVPELEEFIKSESYRLDNHRIVVFYYRIACLYFGSGDNHRAIDYLNLIINQKVPDYRNDIQCFARILSLIAHFELGNTQLIEYQIKSVYRFLLKMEDIQEVQKEIFNFLRKTPRMRERELKSEFGRLRGKLLRLENEPYERRPFLYLDIISWLESKMAQRTVQEVIQEKFLKRRR